MQHTQLTLCSWQQGKYIAQLKCDPKNQTVCSQAQSPILLTLPYTIFVGVISVFGNAETVWRTGHRKWFLAFRFRFYKQSCKSFIHSLFCYHLILYWCNISGKCLNYFVWHIVIHSPLFCIFVMDCDKNALHEKGYPNSVAKGWHIYFTSELF